MSAAAVPHGEAPQVQYVMQAPQQQVVYAAAPQPVAYVGASGAYSMAQPAGQVMYIQGDGQQVFAEGQQVQYVDANGQQVFVDGQEGELAGQFSYAAPDGMEGQHMVGQQMVYGAPMVQAAPARMNVSHEIFAKLAAGGQLTPDEMAQLSGQPAPAAHGASVSSAHEQASGQFGTGAIVPGSPQALAAAAGAAAPGSAKASGKKDKASGKKEKKDKSEKSGSKKAMKASKKKKEKGCC